MVALARQEWEVTSQKGERMDTVQEVRDATLNSSDIWRQQKVKVCNRRTELAHCGPLKGGVLILLLPVQHPLHVVV